MNGIDTKISFYRKGTKLEDEPALGWGNSVSGFLFSAFLAAVASALYATDPAPPDSTEVVVIPILSTQSAPPVTHQREAHGKLGGPTMKDAAF